MKNALRWMPDMYTCSKAHPINVFGNDIFNLIILLGKLAAVNSKDA
jgi:hypothetical protein